MLTLKQLEGYISFDGDIDSLSRAGSGSEISDESWRTIDELCQEMHIVFSGLASPEFEFRFESKLRSSTENELVRSRLEKYVRGERSG